MKVYKSDTAKRNVYRTYDQLIALWNVTVKETDIPTTYGFTHVLECGDCSSPPLVLFHGVGDNSALMWIFNSKELSKHFHIYAIDTIGGPGKSCPNERYQKDFDQIKWLDEVFQNLNIKSAYLAGVSNGSFIAQHYAMMRPSSVIKMICMSGNISAKGTKSPLFSMIKVFLPEALFPTKKNVEKLIKKLTGDHSDVFTKNPTIMEHYTYLLKGFNNMAMSYHKLKTFDEAQIYSIQDKALFLQGLSDPLGNAANWNVNLDKYHIAYQTFPGVGHGINHEISEVINKIISDYFLER